MRKMQRHSTASIAFPTPVLILFAILFSSFLIMNINCPCPATPGKWVYLQFVCSKNDQPIVGLPVTVSTETCYTNESGWAGPFGSGFAPGTYTYTFEWWDGQHSGTVTINCSKRDWFFTFQLQNPVIIKTFRVGSAYENYPPVQGLSVTLDGVGTKQTDANGVVEWILDYPFNANGYTLEWTWNGQPASESVLWQDFSKDGVWSKVNDLEPKGEWRTLKSELSSFWLMG
jgi:hypothetical protein